MGATTKPTQKIDRKLLSGSRKNEFKEPAKKGARNLLLRLLHLSTNPSEKIDFDLDQKLKRKMIETCSHRLLYFAGLAVSTIVAAIAFFPRTEKM